MYQSMALEHTYCALSLPYFPNFKRLLLLPSKIYTDRTSNESQSWDPVFSPEFLYRGVHFTVD